MDWIHGVSNGPVRDNGADWARGLWSGDPRDSQDGEEKVKLLSLLFGQPQLFITLLPFFSNVRFGLQVRFEEDSAREADGSVPEVSSSGGQ